ncbi:MAG: M23 family metallopeptidase, partial [Candidatus Falkowbacteria bacterium]|nr:M23 family metallopeptidase [Candidatus Falkowbacteria bacterium]
MKKIIYLFLFLIIILAFGYYFFKHSSFFLALLPTNHQSSTNQSGSVIPLAELKDRKEKVVITANSTFSELMEQASTSATFAQEIYAAAQPIYDLAKIRQGHALELTYDRGTNELKELVYKINSEDELICNRDLPIFPAMSTTTATSTTDWQVKIIPIPYEVKIKTAQGEVQSSMYQAALDNNIDIRAIIDLADAFQWTIDFAMDPRVGDTFKFIYEERYLDGEYVMPGKILTGHYVNDNTPYDVYYFEESANNKGYFDNQGNSVQKMFLKAPVSFRYISSGYTTGPRYIAAFQAFTSSHMAIDYAAAYGTPVRAVGDGIVTYNRNKPGYGNTITIHHNSTYSTNYCHLSKFAVKYGQHVSQGQVIGYVGSTGYSTGPHLHFEMVKNGVKVNP